MTDTIAVVEARPSPTRLAPGRAALRTGLRWALLGFALIVIAQYVADAPGIAASSTWGSALRLTVPIAVVEIGRASCRERVWIPV